MIVGNNRRNIPGYIRKKKMVLSGLHKPLPGRKPKQKMPGPFKYEKHTLLEIRKFVENTK